MMRWDVSYTRETTKETVWYSEDWELNSNGSFVETESESDAITAVRGNIEELMLCNCLAVEEDNDGLSVFEPSDHDFIERCFDFSARRVYQLLNKDGQPYLSRIPGRIGGHKKLKIYGQLDCPSALRHIARGEYVKHRVFFADEETAIAAGYRPCAICMKEKYLKWKESQDSLEHK